MKYFNLLRRRSTSLLLALTILPLTAGWALASDGVGSSYHGQMGNDTGELGMLHKWCALPNFSFDQEGGIAGWVTKSCNDCHIGSDWNPKGQDAGTEADCTKCHDSSYPVTINGELPEIDVPTIEKCTTKCHAKDTAKRGDIFSSESGEDIHTALGMLCQDCHQRTADKYSDHQFTKGNAIDTTEPTMQGTMSCTTGCHLNQPHGFALDNGKGKSKGKAKRKDQRRDKILNQHIAKVACETCHTGLRPAAALESRKWNVFTESGSPVTTKRSPGWLPTHKWYDNTGAGESGSFHLPILGHTERRDAPGAKIYPFNAVTVDWFVKTETSAYEDVIIVSEVKDADINQDRTTTIDEMRLVYPGATLANADMNFSISHSVVPKELAFGCNDCHGRNGWVLDWEQLGYEKDPRSISKKRNKKNSKKGK